MAALETTEFGGFLETRVTSVTVEEACSKAGRIESTSSLPARWSRAKVIERRHFFLSVCNVAFYLTARSAG